ncbi:MAG: nitroreductase family protein [Solobacterium sp.]|nr:nitroreductase family protein [Solobacterium sp.]
MNTIETIMKRRSIRSFADQPISDEDIRTILKAGMAGPSCVNARDWSFIVITDKEVLAQAADANGRPAQCLKQAAMGILVCGDNERAFSRAKDYSIVDTSIACENMILAAHELGIGSVWLGTWPQMDRVERQKELFRLPETIIPHSLLAFGYPADPEEMESGKPDRPEFEEDRVHFNRW